ncbi:hypothetical protein HanIR_Chr13g0640721 [Helianthus annuus]|nr:hypothetical protein HanIR_Chr13g0640721 [Helianthus annuus]
MARAKCARSEIANEARRMKKAQVTRSHKHLKITVKLHFRRFGDMERARVHDSLYQALPLVYFRLYGQ